MTKVNAAILYNKIAKEQAGFYAFVTLGDLSLLEVTKLLATCPVKVFNSTELHVTLMHCKSDLPDTLDDVPEDKARTGVITEVVEWQDHKDRTIWVLHVESDDLKAAHDLLAAQGVPHSHSDYSAHITIAKDVQKTPEAVAWFNTLNEWLKTNKWVIDFDEKIKASSLE